MNIAITSTDSGIESQIDPRFGRCRFFLIIDPDTMDCQAIPNDSASASGGAGIQAAQTISSRNVSVLITGNVGPNAFETLSAAGIEIFTGASGTVREALDQYKSGNLQSTGKATAGAHAGAGGGRR